MTLLLVVLGGAVGAVARYLTDVTIRSRFHPVLPWGTFTVNMIGSTILGLLAGWGTALPGWAGSLVGVGFCGALTTYSTFGLETIRLASSGGRAYAVINVALTLVVGITAAAIGWWIAA